MLFAGFPVTDSNVTVFTRSMSQENGSDDWFDRNNPLNNGLSSDGGGGLGSYDSLVIAAENAADALHSVGGYGAIVDAFAASAPHRGHRGGNLGIPLGLWPLQQRWALVVYPGTGRRRPAGT